MGCHGKSGSEGEKEMIFHGKWIKVMPSVGD